MRHCLSVCVIVMVLAKAKLDDSLEDHRSYTYNYNPAALNFNEIYTINLPTASIQVDETKVTEEEQPNTTPTENYLLNNIESQFVEFHPEFTTAPPTIPPPRYILNSTFLKTSPKPMITTTTDDEDIFVVPIIKKKPKQRGVLDLLFPETRVKTFRNIFNTIRRMLSHTFRK